jgi:hypothetical protein
LLCQCDSCRQQAGGHHNCQCFDRHNCSCCFSFVATSRPPFTDNRPRAPKCGAAAEITVYLSDLTCSPLTGRRVAGDPPGLSPPRYVCYVDVIQESGASFQGAIIRRQHQANEAFATLASPSSAHAGSTSCLSDTCQTRGSRAS